jgi:hypothetical protein
MEMKITNATTALMTWPSDFIAAKPTSGDGFESGSRVWMPG